MSVVRVPLSRPIPATIGVVVALVLVSGVSGQAWGAPAGARAIRASATCTASPDGVDIGNVDSDGIADLVVGAPTLAVGGVADAGAVDVHLSSGSEQRITAAGLGLTGAAQADARFGAAISVADVNNDGCSDLAVGAPGAGGSGRVYVLHGSPSGIGGAVTTITAPDGAVGDDFGAAVVEIIRGVQVEDLWVGAPGRTVDGYADAGEVYHYVFDASGTPTYVGHVSYAGTVVTGRVHAGDRFASVLAARSDGLVVGVPDRSVAGHAGAGQVVVLSQRDLPLAAEVFDQSSPGVPGTPEAGDHYGASVAEVPMGTGFIVGIPGEDLGSLKDAGAVDAYAYTDGNPHSLKPTVTSYTQDSPLVPGTSEAGDGFGAAVLIGHYTDCDDAVFGYAVGAPGEDIGSIKDAGYVSAWRDEKRLPDCPSIGYRQGTTLPGVAEAGDRLGATLSLLHRPTGNDRENSDYTNDPVIGVPGEDGSQVNSGVVDTVRPVKSYGAVGGPIAGLQYGTVIAQPAFNDSM